jgi:hypothetical protein
LTLNFKGPSSSLGPSDPFAKVAKWPKFRQGNSKSGIKIRLYDFFFTAEPYHEIFFKKEIVSALCFERFYPELIFFEGNRIIISMRKLN